MLFKTESLQLEFDNSPLLLRLLADDFCDYVTTHFAKKPICTRIWEAVAGSSGVHEVHRGIDFRDEHDGVFFFTPDESAELLEYINNKYYRNDGHPTLLHHSFCGGPMHMHLQIAESNMVYVPPKVTP